MTFGASANASHATKRADRRAYAWRAPGRGATRATARFVVEYHDDKAVLVLVSEDLIDTVAS